MVRNAKKAEAEIAALKISYLKKIGKGSNVIIMDSSVHPNHLHYSDFCSCLPSSNFDEHGGDLFFSDDLRVCGFRMACRYNDVSKTVAKTLNSVGFKNCWVMAGGFSGRKGWAQSRLGTDSYNLSVVEVVTPSRVIPAAVAGRTGTTSARIGATSSASRATSRKLLPGSVD